MISTLLTRRKLVRLETMSVFILMRFYLDARFYLDTLCKCNIYTLGVQEIIRI
jgi:hypothetical protein